MYSIITYRPTEKSPSLSQQVDCALGATVGAQLNRLTRIVLFALPLQSHPQSPPPNLLLSFNIYAHAPSLSTQPQFSRSIDGPTTYCRPNLITTLRSRGNCFCNRVRPSFVRSLMHNRAIGWAALYR